MDVLLQCTIVRTVGRSAQALQGIHSQNRGKNPKTPNNRSSQRCRNSCRTVFGVCKRGPWTSSNPYSDLSSCLRLSIYESCFPSLSIYLSTLAKVLLFVCKVLDSQEWLTNCLKYRRGISTGRTIAPNVGVPTGVAMLPYYNISALPICIETIASIAVEKPVPLNELN